MNEDIREELADAIIETEEIKELKQNILDKKDEIKDNEDWEMDDRDFDDELDSIYPEVEIAGQKYSTSNALKNVDEVVYQSIKDEMTDDLRQQKDEELKEELEDMEYELEELLDGGDQ